MQEKTLGELAEYVGGRICGNSDIIIKSASTLAFDVLKRFKESVIQKDLHEPIVLSVSHKLFDYLAHNETQTLLSLEKRLRCKIVLESNEKFEDLQFTIKKAKNINQ